MKKLNIIIVVFLIVNILVVKAQVEMPDIALKDIIEKVNNFDITEIPEGESKTYTSFDFKTFSPKNEIAELAQRYYEVYYGNNKEILRVAQYSKDIEELNFEFLIKEYEGIRIIYSYKFIGCNSESKAIEHKCGEMISGFFVQVKQENDLYFFGTKYSKEAQSVFKLDDIYCIMRLNDEMQCNAKLKFINGFLAYKTEFILSEDLKEKVFCYNYQKNITDEECSKYNNLESLTLKRINHLFLETYHCPVALEATIVPEIPKVSEVYLPAWSLNGYLYK